MRPRFTQKDFMAKTLYVNVQNFPKQKTYTVDKKQHVVAFEPAPQGGYLAKDVPDNVAAVLLKSPAFVEVKEAKAKSEPVAPPVVAAEEAKPKAKAKA